MEPLTEALRNLHQSSLEPELTYHVGNYCSVRRLGVLDVRAAFGKPKQLAMLQACRPSSTLTSTNPEAYLQRLKFFRSLDQHYELELVISRKVNHQPLGYVVLSAYDTHNQKAEFSAAFFDGQGTRAVLEALAWAISACFDGLGLHKLIFYVVPGNTSALALLHRLDINQEACLRDEVRLPDGQRTDLLRYALFDEQWSKIKPTLLALRGLRTDITTANPSTP
jgi:RimJ/RimL family protein N-acetyltransferase